MPLVCLARFWSAVVVYSISVFIQRYFLTRCTSPSSQRHLSCIRQEVVANPQQTRFSQLKRLLHAFISRPRFGLDSSINPRLLHPPREKRHAFVILPPPPHRANDIHCLSPHIVYTKALLLCTYHAMGSHCQKLCESGLQR